MTRFFLGLLASGAMASGANAQAPVEPLKPLPAIPAAPTAVLTEPAACCNRHYVSAEWLYWTVQGNPLPALVTTSPPATPAGIAGVLGQSTTTLIAGGQRANDDFRNGLRITAGYWIGSDQKTGIELSYFFLEGSSDGSSFSSAATPIIARPVNIANQPSSTLVSYPNLVNGAIAVNSTNDFEGAAALLRRSLRLDACGYLDLLAGYRYLNLSDSVSITETRAGGDPRQGVFNSTILDSFSTRNIFNGGTIGIGAGRKFQRFAVDGRALVSLGNLHRTANIGGASQFNFNGQTGNFPGGVLATATNSGTFESDTFCVVPEFGVKAAWQVRDCLRLTAGFDWLLMSHTLRAGDQIDPNFSNTQPAFPNKETTTYVYGVSFGAEFRW